MSSVTATTASCHRPMVGQAVVRPVIANAKRDERIGQPDSGTGGFGQ